jgi:S1-C subfamily serine protease
MTQRRWRLFMFVLIAATAVCSAHTATSAVCSEPFPDLFKRVSPSVVFISAFSIDPFKMLDRVVSVIGSGFIISTDGLILTNSHIVYGRQSITVTLDNGTSTEAKLIGADPILDLAVLRITAPAETLRTAVLGDSEVLRVGEDVIAIGNPLGLEQTLTRGLVSGINRILPESPLSLTLPLIQTDAAINPGNSGGPLLNGCGEVIGITTAILTDAQNIGFAVPIHIAKRVLPQLVEHGRVIRPWLGIGGKVISEELHDLLNLSLTAGFLVETIEPGSPAERMGLHGGTLPMTIAEEEYVFGGDIITTANGQVLDETEKFEEFMRSLKVGDTVQLTLFHDGETRIVELLLPERPILPGDLPSEPRRTMTPLRQKRGRLGLHRWR